jgi:hypothetical protein
MLGFLLTFFFYYD